MIILLDMRYAEKTILWYTEAKNFPRKNASAVVFVPTLKTFYMHIYYIDNRSICIQDLQMSTRILEIGSRVSS